MIVLPLASFMTVITCSRNTCGLTQEIKTYLSVCKVQGFKIEREVANTQIFLVSRTMHNFFGLKKGQIFLESKIDSSWLLAPYKKKQ